MTKIEKELVVANEKGLHARPAALFVSLVEKFDVNGLQKANPTFNQTKLDWFNQHYIMIFIY